MNDVRTVLVLPPNAAREGLSVLRAALSIAIAAFVVSGIRRGGVEAATPIATCQVLFADQPEPVQLKYRELVSGLEDLVRLRSPSDEWPSVETLAGSFVEPFAGGPSYEWEFRRKGSLLNYLGRPGKGKAGLTYLLLLQENVPHPGNAVLDEFHRRLDDGTILHVGVWFHPHPRLADEAVWMPEREGWTEIIRGQEK